MWFIWWHYRLLSFKDTGLCRIEPSKKLDTRRCCLYVGYGLQYMRNKRRTRSFQTTSQGGQLGWSLFSFLDVVFYLVKVLVTRLRVIFMDYNYQYLDKSQSLYLVLFLIIYIGGDETILCTICILPPGFLLIPMEHMFYGRKKT